MNPWLLWLVTDVVLDLNHLGNDAIQFKHCTMMEIGGT